MAPATSCTVFRTSRFRSRSRSRWPNGKREITTALVYNPVTDESFWAEKGRGAWVQSERLRVSGRRDLTEALVATGIPFAGHGDIAQWSRIFGAIAPEVAGIRRFGAAALDLAWVAAGRFDAYWESDLKPWDVAAGMLLVKEAGGFVTDFRGGDRPVERSEFLAANDVLHSKLHKLLAGALALGRSLAGWRRPLGLAMWSRARRRVDHAPAMQIILMLRLARSRPWPRAAASFRPCQRLLWSTCRNICRSCCSSVSRSCCRARSWCCR